MEPPRCRPANAPALAPGGMPSGQGPGGALAVSRCILRVCSSSLRRESRAPDPAEFGAEGEGDREREGEGWTRRVLVPLEEATWKRGRAASIVPVIPIMRASS